MNCLSIMDKSVLMREIEPIPNSSIQEDLAMVMVALKGFFQFIDALGVMNIAVGNVAEF